MSMPHRTRLLALSAVAGIVLAGSAPIAYLRHGAARSQFQGWVEAYFIFVSPDEAGRVETLSVREGDAVTAGAPLFALDADLQRAAVAENEAAVANATHHLRARAGAAEEGRRLAEGVRRCRGRRCARAEARLNSARTRLDRRRVVSPAAGTIQEVYFRVGEMVPAGRPIVSLLPPGNIARALLRAAGGAAQACTSAIASPSAATAAAADLVARVSFISAQAEFTPPVIYSQEERARLVFRVEAIARDACRRCGSASRSPSPCSQRQV